MDILTYTLKWSEVILRWGHVLFAILWVGNSFLFNYLDNKLNKKITSRDIDGEGYLMHSGFFYKLIRLKKSPELIRFSSSVKLYPVPDSIFNSISKFVCSATAAM